MAVHLPIDEQEQLLQTIEMFEVIIQANPDDYQSLDLLREAYAKLGRHDDVRRITLLKAAACLRLGQLDAAHAAVCALQASDPDDPEVARLASELDQLGFSPSAAPLPNTEGSDGDLIALNFSAYSSEDTSLTELPKDKAGQSGGSLDFGKVDLPETDGNDALVEFLRNNNLALPDVLDPALAAVREANAEFSPERVSVPLLAEVFRHGTLEDEETTLLKILNHTKFGFAPLEHYDVDRQIVKMLPKELTLGRLIVPFDLISRTLLIAMANPFDNSGREVCRSLLDYNILWYFARPDQIVRTLAEAYRINRTTS